MPDKSFTGSMVRQALDVGRTFTASIDPQGPGEVQQGVNEMPATGLSLDPDNLDGLSDL